MKRFWLQFDKGLELPPGLIIGCGITAYDEEDALFILKNDVFRDNNYVHPIQVLEDIDISILDQDHVVPNMKPPVDRGVWFPQGY